MNDLCKDVLRYGTMIFSITNDKKSNIRLVGYTYHKKYFEIELELGEIISIKESKKLPKVWKILINSKFNTITK